MPDEVVKVRVVCGNVTVFEGCSAVSGADALVVIMLLSVNLVSYFDFGSGTCELSTRREAVATHISV